MKNICYSGAILALTTLLLTGCEALQKEYMKITLREQDKVLTFGREAGLEKSVTFSSTTSWTASVQGDWLAVAPDSGNSGSNTITVTTLTANDGNDGRTTEITLTAGGDPATITVVQKGTESTDDPDPNNPDPDEPVASDEKFITKIRLTGTEDPNDVSDFYIAYDENGNIVGTDRFDIDMEAMGIDVVCFTGHKSLLGPQGTGGLCIAPGVDIRPFKVGGTGVQTYLPQQPPQYPTRLEAGTLNGHGIAGLSAALDYLEETGLEAIRSHEQALARQFYEGVSAIPGVTVYGDFTTWDRAPVVSLNIRDYDSSQVSDVLAEQFSIATRPGAHCAPRLHRALGTMAQGAVRFSFGWFNTEEETQAAIAAVRSVAE